MTDKRACQSDGAYDADRSIAVKPLAPSPSPWPMWVRLVAVAATMAGASACIIGPKQDDPETATIDPNPVFDSSAGSDTARTGEMDAGTSGLLEGGAPSDTSTAADTGTTKLETGCASDAADASDAACDDGGSDAPAAD
jgi:hypothetical protein